MADQSFRTLLRKAYQVVRDDSFRVGLLGRHNPDTTVDIAVPGRRDYVYVTLSDKTVGIARNEAGLPTNSDAQDLPVKLRLDHGDYIVVGRNTRGELAYPNETPPSGVWPHLLDEHSDVVLTSEAVDDLLAYDGNNWINATFADIANNEYIQDLVAAQFTGNVGVIDATYDDGTGAITLTLDVSAADRILYSTGADAWAETALTAYARTLLDDADAATARTTLGVVAGGAGDIWVEKAGDSMTGNLAIESVAVTGNSLAVLRDLAAASTNAPMVAFVQDNAGDDQAALIVQQDGTGAITILYDGANQVFAVSDGGNVHLGTADALISALRLTLSGTDSGGSAMGFARYSANAGGPAFSFYKSRNASVGSHTVVQSGDVMGNLLWRGSDGSAYRDSAMIRGSVDGTPGSSDMPGRIEFWTTPDSSATLAERMRITKEGYVGVGTTSPASLLSVKAGSSSNDAAVGGVLYVSTTSDGNGASATNESVASYTVPANTLSANNQSIWFEASGVTSGSTASVTISVFFGSSTVFTYTFADSNARHWHIRGRIHRTGAATQKAIAYIISTISGPIYFDTDYTTPTETLSSDKSLRVAVTATAANNVTCHTFTVGFDDANT